MQEVNTSPVRRELRLFMGEPYWPDKIVVVLTTPLNPDFPSIYDDHQSSYAELGGDKVINVAGKELQGLLEGS